MSESRKRNRDNTPSLPTAGERDESSTVIRKKVKLESRRKRPGIAQEIYSETSYYTANGLRHVKPYYFTFTTHAKGRWVGSKIYDVFCKEFQSETPDYYEKAIKSGKVTVNGEVATMETVVKDNELITHRVHRHEPPVTGLALSIIHQDDELVVINKPASIPVHPCGRYRHNSVVFLLAKEHYLVNLHTIHRLDRLTSGLLMFARSVNKAQKLETEIRERRVSKVYLCRVEGEFPSEPVDCKEPILVVTHKVGVCHVDPRGKECSTRFTRLSFNGDTSVVKCEPKTGRMHQIRVHLQWLGHPIINDPIYNHPAWKQNTLTEPENSTNEISDNAATGEGNVSQVKKQTNIERVISEIIRTNYTSEMQAKSQTKLPQKSESKKDLSIEATTSLPVQNAPDCNKSSPRSMSGGTSHQPIGTAQSTTRGEVTDTNCDKDDKQADYGSLASGDSDGLHGVAIEMDEGRVASLADRQYEKDPDCSECLLDRPDPSPSELVMYLHALSYKGDGWEFSTPPPAWADSN